MTNRTASTSLRWIWFLFKAALLLGLVAGVFWWIRLQPVAVSEHEVSAGPLVVEVMGTGTLEARVKATISSRIAGRIQQILVDQGDIVTAGQSLVQLDDSELKQQVAIAEADVQNRQAALVRLEADIARSAAVLKQAQTNFSRMNALVEQKAISLDELDKAAEALAIAESETARSAAANAEGRKALIVSERSLEFQKTKLADAKILAPYAGMIVRRDRDPGDVVVPGSSILSLIATDQLWINAWVDETEMAKLHPGQSARVVFRSEPESDLPGKIVRLGKETDRETREYIVDVEINRLPENWAVGQRAEVYIETSSKTDVVRIPGKFVKRQANQVGAYLNQSGLVVWKPVELGAHGRDFVEIKSGLSPKDIVILPAKPESELREGQRISTK
jgi:HlyD family secretion protein